MRAVLLCCIQRLRSVLFAAWCEMELVYHVRGRRAVAQRRDAHAVDVASATFGIPFCTWRSAYVAVCATRANNNNQEFYFSLSCFSFRVVPDDKKRSDLLRVERCIATKALFAAFGIIYRMCVASPSRVLSVCALSCFLFSLLFSRF